MPDHSPIMALRTSQQKLKMVIGLSSHEGIATIAVKLNNGLTHVNLGQCVVMLDTPSRDA